ncbi:5'-nucleotidase surE [Gossypium arboreum]|uniref:5'-nucleotidase surE n=1 Tax=Gossypium arboreum TaxID=29729 RepID=A0A0B0N438_GOSAR|nr:5'-nucleotidase surE [Gossypium arboreum]
MPMPYPRYGFTWDHISMPIAQLWSYMGSHIDADSPAMVLHEITYRCQSHVPDMVLHGIVHNPNVMTFVS